MSKSNKHSHFQKTFGREYNNDNNFGKVRDHCFNTSEYKGWAHSICNYRFIVPKDIPVIFQNGSNYDYRFIINKLAK